MVLADYAILLFKDRAVDAALEELCPQIAQERFAAPYW